MTFYTPGSVSISQDQNLIPKGSYIAVVDATQETPKSYGTLFSITYKILYPLTEHGAKVREFLCVEHTNRDTQRIALENLEKICQAVCRTEPLGSGQDLLDLKLKIEINHKEDNREAGKL